MRLKVQLVIFFSSAFFHSQDETYFKHKVNICKGFDSREKMCKSV